MRLAAIILTLLTLSGCATTGDNVRWYNPATWFSGVANRKLERVQVKLDESRLAVLGSAQLTAHETQLALSSAPASRPVDVAREANDATVTALDQLAGPLTLDAVTRLRAQVAGLLSEVATERAKAEKERQERREETAEASTRIFELTAEVKGKTDKLAEAFAKENALANELRNQMFWKWGMVGLAVVLGGLWLYARVSFGGIPQAIGRGLSELRLRDPKAGELATSLFDSYLNRSEQRRIAQS